VGTTQRVATSIHTDRELVERERGHRPEVAASNVLIGFGRRGPRDQRSPGTRLDVAA
jgi:hypothetical protein